MLELKPIDCEMHLINDMTNQSYKTNLIDANWLKNIKIRIEETIKLITKLKKFDN